MSVVQDFGVEILLYLDGLKEGKAEADMVKAALVASAKWTPQSLFPEWFPEDEGGTPAGEDVEYDYTEVTWEAPSDSGGIEEFERIQQMLKESGVTVTEDEGPIDESAFFFTRDDDTEDWV